MKSNASSTQRWAVIGDLVGSRRQPSRRAVQASLLDALGEVNALVPAEQPLEATIGDEFQSVHAARDDALLATVLVRLLLPGDLDARCGVGAGPIEVVGESAHGLTQDGPAWWSAREAVDEVKRSQRATPHLHTRLVTAGDVPGAEDGLVNAFLQCRDFIVSSFDDRLRRIAVGVLTGRTVAAIAEDEGISASAVSQRIRRSGIRALAASTLVAPVGGDAR